MTKVVSLRQIPTLRELYQRADISAQPETVRGAHFPPSSTLLDRVSVYRGDITHVQIDAIVNAANIGLLGGGGDSGRGYTAIGLNTGLVAAAVLGVWT